MPAWPSGTAIELDTTLDGHDHAAVLGGTIAKATDEIVTVRVRATRSQTLPVRIGLPVTASVVEGSRIYTFETFVLATGPISTGLEVMLAAPEHLREDQRSFYRLEYRVPVTFREHLEDGSKGRTHQAETIDVGGGGVGVICRTRFDLDTRLTVKVHLDDGLPRPLSAEATIKRVLEYPSASPLVYHLGLVFDAITETNRQRLIRFIFTKQREYRQRGIL